MNVSTFVGRIGRDAEMRTTQSGKSLARWSIAVDQRRGGEKTTLWVECALFGQRGESLCQYLTKGTTVAVTGEINVRTYESEGGPKASLQLTVRDVTLLGGGQRQERQEPASKPVKDDLDSEDIPF